MPASDVGPYFRRQAVLDIGVNTRNGFKIEHLKDLLVFLYGYMFRPCNKGKRWSSRFVLMKRLDFRHRMYFCVQDEGRKHCERMNNVAVAFLFLVNKVLKQMKFDLEANITQIF